MKVITNGKDKVYTTTCRECNSDLEYTDADVFYTPNKYHINAYLQDCRCVKCPVCGNIIKSFYLSDIKIIR